MVHGATYTLSNGAVFLNLFCLSLFSCHQVTCLVALFSFSFVFGGKILLGVLSCDNFSHIRFLQILALFVVVVVLTKHEITYGMLYA
jgi:hypothetical protein